MAQRGKGGRNARGGKETMDDLNGKGGRNKRGRKERLESPKWGRRKDCKRRKGKDG
jgi:hypothetical protein